MVGQGTGSIVRLNERSAIESIFSPYLICYLPFCLCTPVYMKHPSARGLLAGNEWLLCYEHTVMREWKGVEWGGFL